MEKVPANPQCDSGAETAEAVATAKLPEDKHGGKRKNSIAKPKNPSAEKKKPSAGKKKRVVNTQCDPGAKTAEAVAAETKNPSAEEKKRVVNTRCEPGAVTSLIGFLPDAARQKIIDIGFENLLDLKLGQIRNRDFSIFLMERAKVHDDTDTIEVCIRDGVSIWITRDIVHHCFKLPRGSAKELPKEPTGCHNNTFLSFVKEMDVVVQKFKPHKARTKELESNEGEDSVEDDPRVAAKRAVLTPANIELMFKNLKDNDVDNVLTIKNKDGEPIAVTRFYVSSEACAAVNNLDDLKNIDWAHMIFDKLKAAIRKYEDVKKRNMIRGCTVLLMIVFLDLLAENPLDTSITPRINCYTEGSIADLIMEPNGSLKRKHCEMKMKGCPKSSKKGCPKSSKIMKDLSTLNFKNWNDTFYGTLLPYQVESPAGDQDIHRQNSIDNRLDWNSVDSGFDKMPAVDPESVYRTHVEDRTRDSIVVDTGGFPIVESVFVNCLKPCGHMHTEMFYLLCDLWSKDWKNKFILNQHATKELIDPDSGTKALDWSLKAETMKDVKLIFIPIVHSSHWSLVVLSITDGKKYILDSWPNQHAQVAKNVLANLQKYLQTKNILDILATLMTRYVLTIKKTIAIVVIMFYCLSKIQGENCVGIQKGALYISPVPLFKQKNPTCRAVADEDDSDRLMDLTSMDFNEDEKKSCPSPPLNAHSPDAGQMNDGPVSGDGEEEYVNRGSAGNNAIQSSGGKPASGDGEEELGSTGNDDIQSKEQGKSFANEDSDLQDGRKDERDNDAKPDDDFILPQFEGKSAIGGISTQSESRRDDDAEEEHDTKPADDVTLFQFEGKSAIGGISTQAESRRDQDTEEEQDKPDKDVISPQLEARIEDISEERENNSEEDGRTNQNEARIEHTSEERENKSEEDGSKDDVVSDDDSEEEDGVEGHGDSADNASAEEDGRKDEVVTDDDSEEEDGGEGHGDSADNASEDGGVEGGLPVIDGSQVQGVATSTTKRRKKRKAADDLGKYSTPCGKRNLKLSKTLHSTRKLRNYTMASGDFHNEISKCISNNEDELLRVGEISMSGVQLEKFLIEGGNADSIVKAFVHCFNHDETCAIIIPPVEIPKDFKFEGESANAFLELIVAALPEVDKCSRKKPANPQ
ncbi:hypothetical protein ACP70R_040081 [Stipagrostis hirtigluma subsp. patula]